MGGSPGLGTPFGNGTVAYISHQFLKNIFYFNFPLQFGVEYFSEIFFKIFSDDTYYFAKSRPDSIVNRIIHDGFSTGTKFLNLLHTTVPGGHSGGQNQ